MREGRIESRHSTKIMEGFGSRSHNLGAELRMHSLTVDCDTLSNEENVEAVVLVTSVEVEVTFTEAMLTFQFLMHISSHMNASKNLYIQKEEHYIVGSIPGNKVLPDLPGPAGNPFDVNNPL